jgi:hypothetical protein
VSGGRGLENAEDPTLVFPSELAIDGLVRINQMGASLSEVRADWFYLWLLAAIYFILAVVVARRRVVPRPGEGEHAVVDA